MKKLFLAVIGILLIVAGTAGLLLPVVPGWVLIFFGLSFIAPKLAERLKRRFFRKFFKEGIIRLKEWEKFSVKVELTTKHFPLVLKKTDELSDPRIQGEFQKLVPGEKFVFLNQVHQSRVEVLDDGSKYARSGFYSLPATDGVLTNIKNLTLLVLTADCLPIIFCAKARHSKKADWIGLVHAGWRGTKDRIAETAFQTLLSKSGLSAAEIHIIFGPAIRKDHYEVGPEFRKQFGRRFVRKRKGRFYFDLVAQNRKQLMRAGALDQNILDLDICTVCENSDFYSFRKEQDSAGRIVSLITKI